MAVEVDDLRHVVRPEPPREADRGLLRDRRASVSMLVLVSSRIDSAIGCGSREKMRDVLQDAVLEDLEVVALEAASRSAARRR